MSVPYFDYPKHFLDHEEEHVAILRRVMGRGAFISQQELRDFEASLAAFVGARHAVGVADGTNALALGLKAIGVGPGDEVLFPSHTFVATYGAIVAAGAVGVPVDMGEDGLMDPDSAEAAITGRTRAVLPVQLNGRVCRMDRLLDLAGRHGLALAEDSCQALGARFDGRAAGTFGAFGAFSFYPAKSLGCFGDGGAIVTDDEEVARKVRLMRDHGRDEAGIVQMPGTNARLDNIQAAILNFKLKSFKDVIGRRREIARRYEEAFMDIDELLLPPGPDAPGPNFDTYQNYELCAEDRDRLREHLAADGVGTLVQWGGRAVHQFPALGLRARLPRTERFFERCLMLPMNQHLDDGQVAHVASSVRRFYGKG